MSDKQQVNQLWAACSDELQRSLNYGNSANIKDPALLMENIRLIAVKKLNNLVNIVEFQTMSQFNDETITAFATRLSGHANLCDMNTTCDQCDQEISLKKKMIMYQFVHCLKDHHAQERILEASEQEEGGELALEKVVKLAESFETGKQSQELVNKSGQVSKLSDHQRNKQKSCQDSRPKDSNKYGNCESSHTSKQKLPGIRQTMLKMPS